MTACTTDNGSEGATDPTLQVIDPQALVERCMGEASTASALLSMFHDRLPRLVAEIGVGLSQCDDLKATLSKIHTLKGNAGNLSADRLYQVAALLEAALHRDATRDVSLLLQNLLREADALCGAIPAVLETLS